MDSSLVAAVVRQDMFDFLLFCLFSILLAVSLEYGWLECRYGFRCVFSGACKAFSFLSSFAG